MSLARVVSLLGLITAVPALAQQLPTVPVALHSYSYAPSPIRLQAGRPVRLFFTNAASKGHDFTARRFFASARILAGTAPEGEIDLRPGQSSSIDLIPSRGRYQVHCGHFMHKQLGMRSEIIVE